MLLLGIDLGTSSVKVSVVDAESQQCIASAQYPETEQKIIQLRSDWAEQSPNQWWEDLVQAVKKMHSLGLYDPQDIAAIGIAYQMHGLVMVDKDQQVLRNAIIWCDSRAVEIGNNAFDVIGHDKCLSRLLNSPGNFTAAKLAWVKEHEPHIYEQIHKIMLPGDFIAMKLTGHISTTASALSEGVFWDFEADGLSEDVLNYFGFSASLIPEIRDVFSEHGLVSTETAGELKLKAGIPVTYKAGDQPNNAFSLNVLDPGEVAATAGTSGVIYGVGDTLEYDKLSRINSFAHVNHSVSQKRIGTLLCINGTGIANSYARDLLAEGKNYADINAMARNIQVGSDGLYVLPFGNGAERMLCNRKVGASYQNLDFNLHTKAHILRAVQEGVAFSFRYGFDIMRENGITPSVIRAGKANMFLSDVFLHSFVNSIDVPVELYETDGSTGAAKGAGVGVKVYRSAKEAFVNMKLLEVVEPSVSKAYNRVYEEWKQLLDEKMERLMQVETVNNYN